MPKLLFGVVFFAGIPLFLIGAFVLGVIHPKLAQSYGGISNILTFLSSLLTYIYVVFTGMTIRHMVHSREEESRPYVVVDFDMINHSINLVIDNIGRQPARNVRFSFVPELIGLTDHNLSQEVFGQVFSLIPPGKRIKTFLNSGPEIFGGRYPLDYKVTITYEYGKGKRAEDTYDLSLRPYEKLLFTPEYRIHDLVNLFEDFNKTFSRVVKWDGIYVKTTEDVQRDSKQTEDFFRSVEAQAESGDI